MLIKLGSGFTTDLKRLRKQLEVGSPVFRYVDTEAYDKGEVSDINADEVTVDFADNVRQFDRTDFSLVFGNGQDEHWAVIGGGEVVTDYRGKLSQQPHIESLSDLLDFDRWMV